MFDLIFFLIMAVIVVGTMIISQYTVFFKKGKRVELGGDYQLFYNITKKIRGTKVYFEVEGRIIIKNIIKVEAHNGFVLDIYQGLNEKAPMECFLNRSEVFKLEEKTTKAELKKQEQKLEREYLKKVEVLAVNKVAELIKEKNIIKNAKVKKL